MERYKDEILTDNTKNHYCDQCKDCSLWGLGDDPFSNRYDKGNCSVFPNPGHKPIEVINNKGLCPYKIPRENG